MTDSYSLRIKRSAEKELRTVSPKDLPKIVERIRALASDPRPSGSRKLTAQMRYRIRQGDYRILYTVDDAARDVEIIKIGHRREVYR